MPCFIYFVVYYILWVLWWWSWGCLLELLMKCNHLDHFFDRQFIGDVWWIPVVSKVSRKSDISITFKSDDDDEVNFNVLCCCWECFSLLSPFMFVYLKCEWVLIWGSTGNLYSTSRLWGSVVLVMVMVMVFGKFWIGDNVVHDSTKRPIFCYLSSAVLLISARAPPLQRQRHIGSVWIWFRKDSTVIRFDEWTIPNRTYL